MKSFIVFICLMFFSMSIFAMPCPTNSAIIYKGNTLNEVIKQCGEPLSSKKYIKIIDLTEKWEYYKSTANNTNSYKIEIIFKNNVATNIAVTNNNTFSNVSSTSICGKIINVGDNNKTISTACGQPTTHQILEENSVPIIELIYGHEAMDTLVFEGGKLVDWK